MPEFNTISISYKKFRPSESVKKIVVDINGLFYNLRNVRVINLPNWLLIKNITVTEAGVQNDLNVPPQAEADFVINQSVANTFNPGVYTQRINFLNDANAFPLGSDTSGNTKWDVTLIVLDSIQLSISPTVMSFETVLGQSNNTTTPLRITSENSWSVVSSESWITTTQQNGVGNGLIRVGVDTTGLVVGNYSGFVVVDDGYSVKNLTVNLIITGEQNTNDFLKVRPGAAEFVEALGIAPTTTKNIDIESSEAFTVTANQPWIVLGASSGVAGITSLAITTDSIALLTNVYQGRVEVKSGDFIKNIYITLTVTEVKIVGVASNGLYYSQDRNKISITSSQENTVAELDFEANTLNGLVPFSKNVPFFRSLASVSMGLETENLLQPNALKNILTTRLTSLFKPIFYDFTIKEKQLYLAQSLLRESYNNVYFLNGKTPEVTNRLTYLPQKITTTKDAVISLSLLGDSLPSSIEINGDIIDTVTVSGFDNGPVYTAFVNLSDYPDLVAGNKITITVADQLVQVVIKNTEPEHTLLIFENEWQLPEHIMLTGRIRINYKKGWLTTTEAFQGKQRTRIFDTKTPIDFRVNTGWIYSQEEVDWLSKIFDSKSFYLYIDGEYIEVIPKISSLENRRTHKNLVSFDLNFTKAIV